MDSALAKTIGDAARAARTARRLSQTDAAEAVGISLEFYARIERGGTLPSAPTLRSIARALGVSADALLGLGLKGSTLNAVPSPATGKASSPELRRLLRRLRVAKPKTLRLLSAVAAAVEGR